MTYRYDFAETPFGDALLVFSDEGLVALDLPESMHRHSPWALEATARMLHAAPEPDPGAGAEVDILLRAYFAGEPIRFDHELALDWRLAHGFTRAALQAVCEVPWAESASYGEIAAMAGSPGAGRAVGTACRNSPFSIVVPVHRVVRADGSAGHYGAHPERKRYLLELEADAADSVRARSAHDVRPGV